MEQTKEFIEEFNDLHKMCNGLLAKAFYILQSDLNYRTVLKGFVRQSDMKTAIANQNTFAKIWAGEIELVEKKPKYVIWTKGSMGENSAVFLYNNTMHDYISSAITRKSEAKNDERYNFDENFAFTLRDTGEFKIEKVVE